VSFIKEHITGPKKLELKGDFIVDDQNINENQDLVIFVLSFVFFRIQKYSVIPKEPKEKYWKLEYNFILNIYEGLTDNIIMTNPIKLKVFLSCLLNYSRGLLDKGAEYMVDFATDITKLLQGLTSSKEYLKDIDTFNLTNEYEKSVLLGIEKFKKSLNSQWAKDGLKNYLSSVNLENSSEEAIKLLKSMPIYLTSSELGIMGFVSFGFIVISVANIKKAGVNISIGKNLTDFYFARTFMLTWHEAAHYLVRKMQKNYLSVTRRAKVEEKWATYEAGYRLEFFFLIKLFNNKF